MRTSRLAGAAVVLGIVTSLTIVDSGPALAATPPDALYVGGANCSNTGPGSQAQPYCSLAAAIAAVVPGQTINVASGAPVNMTIDKSGTPGAPITIQHIGSSRLPLTGTSAGLHLDGQHDLAIIGFSYQNMTGAGITVNNSARITLKNLEVTQNTQATVPPVQLTAVTDSTLAQIYTGAHAATSVTMDVTTSGVTLTSASIGSGLTAPADVDIAGPNNTILDSGFSGGAGLLLEPTATGTVVANNIVRNSSGEGIDVNGASGTAVTNNTVEDNCHNGVWVHGAATGVSVQNNVVRYNGSVFNTVVTCAAVTDGVDIALSDAAMGQTTVDYNDVYQGGRPTYRWGTPMTLAPFRAASGQAAHDDETVTDCPPCTVDAANSAAPGYQSTDRSGNQREDDPATTNSGAGPVTYADRGADEVVKGPTAWLSVSTSDLSLTADASGSRPGWIPIVSYTFGFGDGTVLTQASPVAHHQYAAQGDQTVSVTVTDANGSTSKDSTTAGAWQTARAFGLLSVATDRYVTVQGGGGGPLEAVSATVGSWEQFDLVVVNGARVALRGRATGGFASPDPVYGILLEGDPTMGGAKNGFTLVNNADGTISLLSDNGFYVTADGNNVWNLTANRTAIGPWEKFNPVDLTNTAVSLHAHANGRYVTAENAGTQPLIANRTAAGPWEQLDLIDAGNGYVALYSHANGHFVTAEAGGTQALIANRTTIGPWEQFTLITNSDGSISLLARANGRYVTAENAGTQALIANRGAVGAWEEFDRVR